jgi:hypothetical protein
VVDRSVGVLIECGECYLGQNETIFMIVTNLMKLAGKDMTTRHVEIKEFMVEVQRSSNYLTHKIAEGTHGAS